MPCTRKVRQYSWQQLFHSSRLRSPQRPSLLSTQPMCKVVCSLYSRGAIVLIPAHLLSNCDSSHWSQWILSRTPREMGLCIRILGRTSDFWILSVHARLCQSDPVSSARNVPSFRESQFRVRSVDGSADPWLCIILSCVRYRSGNFNCSSLIYIKYSYSEYSLPIWQTCFCRYSVRYVLLANYVSLIRRIKYRRTYRNVSKMCFQDLRRPSPGSCLKDWFWICANPIIRCAMKEMKGNLDWRPGRQRRQSRSLSLRKKVTILCIHMHTD